MCNLTTDHAFISLMLAEIDSAEIKYYRVADRSSCLPFGRIDVLHYQVCNTLLGGFLPKCMTVSAAATHCSAQSEKRSSMPVRCVAFLKNME